MLREIEYLHSKVLYLFRYLHDIIHEHNTKIYYKDIL